jgi:hypothetical protein
MKMNGFALSPGLILTVFLSGRLSSRKLVSPNLIIP